MTELRSRNSLVPDDVVSCIFTATNDLDAEFPAVAARRIGFERVPAPVRAGDRRSRVPAARDPRPDPPLRARGSRRPARLPGGGAQPAGRPRLGTVGTDDGDSSSRRPSAASPTTRRRRATRGPDRSCAWRATSRPTRRCRRWSTPSRACSPASTATRTRRTARCRRRLSDRYGVPAERIAVGNGSCDILIAAGEALLEPGAELIYAWPSFSVYPHLGAASGARAIEVALDADDRHDLAAMAAEITVATRLVIVCNPNNPTSTAIGLEAIAALPRRASPTRVCVILDEAYCEFNLLDDPDSSIDLLGPPSEPRAAADVLQGPRPLRPAGRLRPVRVARAARRGQPRSASRSSATRRPRPRRSRRSAARTRSPSGSSGRCWPAPSCTRASPAWASTRRSRRPTSAGSRSATAATTRRSSTGSRPAGRARPGRRRRSAGRERCVSPTGRRRRTPGSSTCSAACSA